MAAQPMRATHCHVQKYILKILIFRKSLKYYLNKNCDLLFVFENGRHRRRYFFRIALLNYLWNRPNLETSYDTMTARLSWQKSSKMRK